MIDFDPVRFRQRMLALHDDSSEAGMPSMLFKQVAVDAYQEVLDARLVYAFS